MRIHFQVKRFVAVSIKWLWLVKHPIARADSHLRVAFERYAVWNRQSRAALTGQPGLFQILESTGGLSLHAPINSPISPCVNGMWRLAPRADFWPLALHSKTSLAGLTGAEPARPAVRSRAQARW
jgi:hypothetical protein